MDLTVFLYVIGGFIAVAILAYIIVRTYQGTEIIQSTVATFGEIEADQFYFLPGYGMTIKAAASVVLYRNSSQEIKKYEFRKLKLEAEVALEPDTSELIALKYKADWFSSDEFTVTTSQDSLLQNITAVSDDKIATIIKEFTAAPEEALREIKDFLKPDKETLTTELVEMSKTFKVKANEVSKGGIKLDWQIPANRNDNGKRIDISPVFKNKNAGTKASLTTSFAGVLTRPMSFQTWELHGSPIQDASFTCYAPDASRLIKVPIRRSYFIKKQQLPKFSGGILIENHITKDSEVEGLLQFL